MSINQRNPIISAISHWFNHTFANPEALGLFFTVLFGFLMIEFFGGFLTPMIMSVIFAYLLVGPVRLLQRCHCPHILAVLIVFLLFMGLFILMVLIVLPSLWRQAYYLVADIPQVFSHVQGWLQVVQQNHPKFFTDDQVIQAISGLKTQSTQLGKWLISHSLTTLPSVFQIMMYLILVPLLLFFFLKDRAVLVNWVRQYMPKHPGLVLKVWSEFNIKIGAYIRGRCIELIIVFVVLAIVYSWLGLPYALSLAGLFAVSQLIPIIGGIISTIPIVIIALMHWGFEPIFWAFLIIPFSLCNNSNRNPIRSYIITVLNKTAPRYLTASRHGHHVTKTKHL